MAFGYNHDVELELCPHEVRMDMPDEHIIIFPDHDIQFRIDGAEGTGAFLKTLPHAVVLLVRTTALEAEQFFFS